MNQNPYRRFQVCSLLIFLVHISTAQIKQGFERLEERQWAKARAAFEKDLNDPAKSPFARFGLAKIALHNAQGNLDSIAAAAQELGELTAAFRSPSDVQKEWMKKYKISKNTTDRLRFNLFLRICTEIDNAGSLSKYDEFADKHPDLIPEMDTCLAPALQGLVEKVYDKGADYDELTALYKKHADLLALKNLRFGKGFDQKILNLFLKKYGYEKLKKLREDHPNHWVSSDCWLDEFVEAVNAKNASSPLRFLNARPNSILDGLASSLAVNRAPDSGLSPEEAQRFTYIRLTDSLLLQSVKLDSPGVKLFSAGLKRWISYPFHCHGSFRDLHIFIQRLLDAGADQDALALLQDARRLYPDGQPENCQIPYLYYSGKQDWFASALKIIGAPRQALDKHGLNDVNTVAGNEISPVVSLDGASLYFAGSGRTDNVSGEDVFVSRRSGGHWGKPKIVPALSGPGDQSPLSLTADGATMLLAIDGKLAISALTGQDWSAPKIFTEFPAFLRWIGKATMSADGNTVIFEAASDADALQSIESNIKLYRMGRTANGAWEFKGPLPPSINLPSSQTRSPFLHADGKTLYFSSNGLPGLGDADVFMTQRTGKSWSEWSEPQNMGKEFNTTFDDWGINFNVSLNGNVAYYASANGYQDDASLQEGFDIYSVQLPPDRRPNPVALIKGHAFGDRLKSMDMKNAMIYFIDVQTGKPVDSTALGSDGTYMQVLPLGVAYQATISKPAIFPLSHRIDLTGLPGADGRPVIDSSEMVTASEMLEKGRKAPLNGLLFEKNDSALHSASYGELDQFSGFVGKNNWRMEIIGHTDDTGAAERNQLLSEGRARAVKNYLAAKGCNPDLITVTGKGAAQPLRPNDTEENRRFNRRVEILIKPAPELKTGKK